jgi:hypothetical protein
MKSQSRGLLIAAAVVAMAGAGVFAVRHAYADGEDSWDEFRADVEAKCLEAATAETGLFTQDAGATVDPFGSESYGLALIEGPARGAEDVTIRSICVYDKTDKAVEIGGELPA